MGKRALLATILFMGIQLVAIPENTAAMTPADKEQYEQLGLSETEWKMILDVNMPVSKVKDILRCGVSMTDYFNSPWEELDMSEHEWLAKHRAGLSDKDIRAAKHITIKKPQDEGSGILTGFFLPGVEQLSRGQTQKGWIMAGAAIACVTLCVTHSAVTKKFQPLGVILLVPDMFWSGIDISGQLHNEINPNASKFTYNNFSSATIAFTLSIPLLEK
jgi:hypothetical protein